MCLIANMSVECLQLKLGSCRGCNVLDMVADRARWKRVEPKQAGRDLGAQYCPPNASPQTDLIRNTEASFGMGQSRDENLDFKSTRPDPKGQKLHGRY